MNEMESRYYGKKTNSVSKLNTMNNKSQAKNLQQIQKEVYAPFCDVLIRVLEMKAFGIIRKPIELISITSSHGNDKGDRFNLSIPYAHQTLNWTVLFNASCPELGPDFEFSDKTFLADPSVEFLEEHVPTLTNWDLGNHDCLLNVITELILCYKNHQITKLPERLKDEYTSLIESTEICPADVEVLLQPDIIDPTEVHFLIRIALDFSQLPGRKNKLENDAAMLQFTFNGLQWSRVASHLTLSASIQEIFGNLKTHSIPYFSSTKYLIKYVPEIKTSIDDKIKAIVVNHMKKKEYIAAVLCQQDGSVLEYDGVDFSNIALLLTQQDFYFILRINLTQKFPEDPPKYTLISPYHFMSKEELYSNHVNDYPYSPRWEATKMLTKALNFIFEKEVQKLKFMSTKMRRR